MKTKGFMVFCAMVVVMVISSSVLAGEAMDLAVKSRPEAVEVIRKWLKTRQDPVEVVSFQVDVDAYGFARSTKKDNLSREARAFVEAVDKAKANPEEFSEANLQGVSDRFLTHMATNLAMMDVAGELTDEQVLQERYGYKKESPSAIRNWFKSFCSTASSCYSRQSDYWLNQWHSYYNKHRTIGKEAFKKIAHNAVGACAEEIAAKGAIDAATKVMIQQGSRQAASALVSKIYGFITFPQTFLKICESSGLTGYLLFSNARVNSCAIQFYKSAALARLFQRMNNAL